MSDLFFYQIDGTDQMGTLRPLLRRARGNGWNVALRSRSDELLRRLDGDLWMGPEEEFLPHGLEGGEFDAEQPILLTLGGAPANRAEILVLLDGSELGEGEIASYRRISILFRRPNADELRDARAKWKRFSEKGFDMQFWAQSAGKWALKAKSGESASKG